MLRRSRFRFASNFARQKARLTAGIALPRRHRCRCQKHPCTKITRLSRRITMSGRPGNPLPCSRYRIPIAVNTFRTANSGAVSLLRMLAIRALRWLLLRGSMKVGSLYRDRRSAQPRVSLAF